MIESGLREWLLQQSAILALLSGSGAQPVYIDQADVGSGEYLLIESQDTDLQNTLNPDEGGLEEVISEPVTITVKGETRDRANNVARRIANALADAVGNIGNRLVYAVNFEGFTSSRENPDGAPSGRRLVELRFTIQHGPQS